MQEKGALFLAQTRSGCIGVLHQLGNFASVGFLRLADDGFGDNANSLLISGVRNVHQQPVHVGEPYRLLRKLALRGGKLLFLLGDERILSQSLRKPSNRCRTKASVWRFLLWKGNSPPAAE